MVSLIRKLALRATMKKAVDLHKKGFSIDQIKEKFYTKPKVVEGLVALGIDDTELTKMIEKEIKKK